MALIVAALSALNLEHVVFDIMAGIRDKDRSPNDTAYMVVLGMTILSLWVMPVLVASYAWLAYKANDTAVRAFTEKVASRFWRIFEG